MKNYKYILVTISVLTTMFACKTSQFFSEDEMNNIQRRNSPPTQLTYAYSVRVHCEKNCKNGGGKCGLRSPGGGRYYCTCEGCTMVIEDDDKMSPYYGSNHEYYTDKFTRLDLQFLNNTFYKNVEEEYKSVDPYISNVTFKFIDETTETLEFEFIIEESLYSLVYTVYFDSADPKSMVTKVVKFTCKGKCPKGDCVPVYDVYKKTYYCSCSGDCKGSTSLTSLTGWNSSYINLGELLRAYKY